MKQILIVVGVLGAALVLMLVLSRRSEEQLRRPPRPTEVVVNTLVIQKQTLPVRVRAWGRVRSQSDIELHSEVEGPVLAGDHPFLAGTRFARNEVLLRVDERPTRLALGSARSQLLKAAASALPELRFDSPQDAEALEQWIQAFRLDEPVQPLPEARTSKSLLLVTRFDLPALWNTVRNLELTLEKHVIRAPFDCTVIRADLRPGATARKGASVGRLLDLGSLEVEAEVPGAELHFIRRGDQASVLAPGNGETLRGEVVRIGRQVDPNTRTVPVYIRLADADRQLMEGVFVEVRFRGSRLPEVVRLPGHVLGGNATVSLIEEGRLARRRVQVEHMEEDSLLVGAGLQNGDTLVVDVLQGVSLGTLLRDARAMTDAPAGERP